MRDFFNSNLSGLGREGRWDALGKGPPQSPTCRVAVYLHVFIRIVPFGALTCYKRQLRYLAKAVIGL